MWRVLAAIACLGATACATPKVGEIPGVTAVVSELPVPSRGDLTADERPYYLGPYDKLTIEVFGMPDLRRTVQVDASGRLSYPLAGTVEVSGRTAPEVADLLADRLKASYVRDPQVTVNLEEALSQTLTVDGQVARPGAFPVIGSMTLNRAIARAGGLTALARKSDVVIFRTVDGQQYAGLYNLEAIRRGNYPDPEVYSSDVIIVGESAARRLFQDALGASSLLSPLIILTGKQ